LFNVLVSRIDFAGISVLDLYAGSGALGLEAMSRGATSALFVEADHRAAGVLAKNIASLGLTAAVRREPVAAVLAGGADQSVDLVFADPPYDIATADIEAMVAQLVSGGWATDGTVVVVERPTSRPELTWPAGWRRWPSRRYGDTRIELAEA
jgi:16S rRNA (guanine(966)-N(2))-methyltransferase RsmD